MSVVALPCHAEEIAGLRDGNGQRQLGQL